jgi:uncharacterized protein (DUF2062 family)
MMRKSLDSIHSRVASWLRQGISPQRLALTLALGFAIGCIPILGVTTVLCMVVAVALRLNFPIIQAANWAAMPLQVVMLVPFVRMGGKLFASGAAQAVDAGLLLHHSPWFLMTQLGGMTAHALLAWLLLAGPGVVLMTAALTVLLRRLPSLAATEAGG